jgi:hypothetical protein
VIDKSMLPTGVKRAAQAASVSVGRVTSSGRMLPGFLIAGAQRCGTTSMYRTLSQHPALLKAVLHKGVHYFDTAYHRGLPWYRAHFPLRRTARRVEDETGIAPLTFESSPYYMFHPLAGERIRRDLPGVKLIVLLRDPVERAYSAHAHELARGFETVASFEEALELEAERIEGEAGKLSADPGYHSHGHQHHAYLSRGQYVDYLQELEKIFGRERLHVVDSHAFFTNPEPIYHGVLEFLGVPPREAPTFERHNARPRSPMPESLRARLTDHFTSYDQRLADWLGHPPSWRT